MDLAFPAADDFAGANDIITTLAVERAWDIVMINHSVRFSYSSIFYVHCHQLFCRNDPICRCGCDKMPERIPDQHPYYMRSIQTTIAF